MLSLAKHVRGVFRIWKTEEKKEKTDQKNKQYTPLNYMQYKNRVFLILLLVQISILKIIKVAILFCLSKIFQCSLLSPHRSFWSVWTFEILLLSFQQKFLGHVLLYLCRLSLSQQKFVGPVFAISLQTFSLTTEVSRPRLAISLQTFSLTHRGSIQRPSAYIPPAFLSHTGTF